MVSDSQFARIPAIPVVFNKEKKSLLGTVSNYTSRRLGLGLFGTPEIVKSTNIIVISMN
jgi:hypothetical protein